MAKFMIFYDQIYEIKGPQLHNDSFSPANAVPLQKRAGFQHRP